MFQKQKFENSEPIVWVRGGRGGPGYEDRAVGRVLRASTGRITVQVYRADDGSWVIRSVAAEELQRPNAADMRRLTDLERADLKAA